MTVHLSIAACLNHIITVKLSEATKTILTDRQALHASSFSITSLRSRSSSIHCIDTNIDTDSLALATGILIPFSWDCGRGRGQEPSSTTSVPSVKFVFIACV
jgi:hypothetical protein